MIGEGNNLTEVSAFWTPELLPGSDTRVVEEESAVSKALSAAVKVVVAGADDKLPNLYVVAIGISDYPAPLTLRYAAEDARMLNRQTFREKGRGVFGRVEVKLLTDGEATRHGIAKVSQSIKSISHPFVVTIFRDPRIQCHTNPSRGRCRELQELSLVQFGSWRS